MADDVGGGYPYARRLEAGQPGALQPLPAVLGFSSDRHRGYAVQWIALGALVLFGWIGFGIKRAGIKRARAPRR
jgi:cytochrome oxidase assembly protein ShyY1